MKKGNEIKTKLSVLVVMFNEESYIVNLLRNLLNQSIPREFYEVILVDGMSTDNTIDLIKPIVEKHKHVIKLLENTKKTLPIGWNIGIKAASGDYIIRIDGHTSIERNFLENYINLIEKQPSVECIGGVIDSRGIGFQGTINQYVYSHPFGVGNSKFRTTKHIWEGFVDTVPYGAYKREVFEKVGYFNGELKRNEDIEFHKRMKDQGMRFYLSTSIRSIYYVRPTLKGLILKSLADGTWNIIANQSVPGSLRLRHKAPLAAFLFGLAILILAMIFNPMLWALCAIVIAYLIGAAWASKGIINQSGLKFFLPTIWTFFCLHFFRGLGCFKAYLKKEYWWIRRKRKLLHRDN